jgi:surface antigen
VTDINRKPQSTDWSENVSEESLPAPAPRRQRIAGAGRSVGCAPPCCERSRRGFGRLAVALVTMFVGALAIALGGPAVAETLGYPNATASAYRPSTLHSRWWVDENGDGRKQVPAELISGRGYPYRNSTDFVAWWLQSLGVADAQTRGLGNAGGWPAAAALRPGIAVRDTPVRFGVADRLGNPGHVAFVDDVLPDGRITVFEYNARSTGEGAMWTGTPSSRGFTKFVDFGLSIGRVAGSPVTMARNSDGRLEVFGVAANGAVVHQWQLIAGGLWSGWSQLGGTFAAVAAETNADGRVEVFAVAADGSIAHKWQETAGRTWSRWTQVGGRLANITMTRSHDGRLEVFGSNASQGVYRKAQLDANGRWSGWSPFGHGLTDIAADTNADGRVEVFGIASDGAITHTREQAPGGPRWSPWERVKGRLDRIALARSFDGRLEAFGTNSARGMFRSAQQRAGAQWSAWTAFGGGLVDVAAETNADGRLEVFGVAVNGVVAHTWQRTPGGRWSPWTKADGVLRP